MAILSTVSVSSENFSLVETLCNDSEVQVELEAVVPTREILIPYIRVRNSDPQTVADTIRQDPDVEEFEIVESHGGELLVRVMWTRETDGLLSALSEANGVLIGGTGTGGQWRFEVRFDTHDDLSSYFEYCRANGVAVTVERVQNPAMDVDANEILTPTQRETLQVAFDRGYFHVPREAGLTELADLLGISDSAVSQRLRRGLDSLVGAYFDSAPTRSDF